MQIPITICTVDVVNTLYFTFTPDTQQQHKNIKFNWFAK